MNIVYNHCFQSCYLYYYSTDFVLLSEFDQCKVVLPNKVDQYLTMNANIFYLEVVKNGISDYSNQGKDPLYLYKVVTRFMAEI